MGGSGSNIREDPRGVMLPVKPGDVAEGERRERTGGDVGMIYQPRALAQVPYAGGMVALAVILFLNAAFNALTWPNFFRRVVKDPRARDSNGKATAFLTVHLYIFIAAMVMAALSLVAGVAALAGGFD